MRQARIACFAAALALLAACTTQPAAPPVDLSRLEADAGLAVESGEFGRAAQIYFRLADSSRGQQRAEYLIAGSRLLIEDGDWLAAEARVTEAATTADGPQVQVLQVLRAAVEVGLGRPQGALEIISGLPSPMPAPLSEEVAEIEGRALFALGRYADAVRVLVDREIWLDSSEDVLENQRLIWDGLTAGGSAAVFAARPSGDPTVDGWLALAPLTALTADTGAFRVALIDWRGLYPNHPAANGILGELLAPDSQGGLRPTRVALLLPLGSTRRIQAQAVRDGFLAAHLESGINTDTEIRVYDTEIRGAADAFLQAQLDGADFIVGPLLQDNVDAIISQAGFIPTLALNFAQINTEFPPSLYQFALAPQDEAEAVAARAIAAGHKTAVELFPSSDRGYRLADSFRTAFEGLGGQVLSSTAYVPESENFATPIAELLNIVRSEQRHRRLQANLGQSVEFEPRRRQDVDMIFLQADSRMGRLLAPQLRFNYAGDIPTYSTSDVYDPGRIDSDSDLNGVIFPDLPLLIGNDDSTASLAAQLQRYWPRRARQWVRYYAFGFDAYHLIGRLYTPSPFDWPMNGVTGDLNIDAEGRIHRALPFAQFQGGRPIAMEPLPLLQQPLPEFPEIESPPIQREPSSIQQAPDFVGAR